MSSPVHSNQATQGPLPDPNIRRLPCRQPHTLPPGLWSASAEHAGRAVARVCQQGRMHLRPHAPGQNMDPSAPIPPVLPLVACPICGDATAVLPETIRGYAAAHSASIHRNARRLRALTPAQLSAIHSRWTSRTMGPGARRDVLLAVWPRMPRHADPDFRAASREVPGARAQFRFGLPRSRWAATALWEGEHRRRLSDSGPSPPAPPAPRHEPFLWPHFNAQDLSRYPETLLTILRHRSTNGPGHFAIRDSQAVRFAERIEAISLLSWEELREVQGCDMAFVGEGELSYGRFVPSPRLPTGNMPTAVTELTMPISPRLGVLTLQVQERIYDFLVAMCELILQEKLEEPLHFTCWERTDFEWPDSDEGDNREPALDREARLSVHRPAHRLDLGRLIGFVSAKHKEAIEHLRLLEIDPSYFSTWGTIFKECHVELLDTFQPYTLQPRNRRSRRAEIYNYTWSSPLVRLLVQDATLWVSAWDKALETLIHLQAMADDENLASGEQQRFNKHRVPGKLLKAFAVCYQFIDTLIERLSRFVKAAFVRGVEKIRPQEHQEPQEPQEPWKSSIASWVWMMTHSWDDIPIGEPWKVVNSGVPLNTERFPRQLHRIAKHKHRDEVPGHVSHLMMSRLGHLAVLAQCKDQLRVFMPSFEGLESAPPYSHRCVQDYIKLWDWGSPVQELSMSSRVLPVVFQPGQRVHCQFDEPWRCHFCAVRSRGRRRLNTFWDEYDREQQRLLGGDMQLSAKTTWEAYVNVVSQSCPGGDGNELSRPATASPSASEADDRGTSVQGQQWLSNVDWEGELRKLPIDHRAYRVLAGLFLREENDEVPDIPWKDFLHAMRSAGFTVRKLYDWTWEVKPDAAIWWWAGWRNGESITVTEPKKMRGDWTAKSQWTATLDFQTVVRVEKKARETFGTGLTTVCGCYAGWIRNEGNGLACRVWGFRSRCDAAPGGLDGRKWESVVVKKYSAGLG